MVCATAGFPGLQKGLLQLTSIAIQEQPLLAGLKMMQLTHYLQRFLVQVLSPPGLPDKAELVPALCLGMHWKDLQSVGPRPHQRGCSQRLLHAAEALQRGCIRPSKAKAESRAHSSRSFYSKRCCSSRLTELLLRFGRNEYTSYVEV